MREKKLEIISYIINILGYETRDYVLSRLLFTTFPYYIIYSECYASI